MRALRAAYPLVDLDALLGMEDDELEWCVDACRDLYGPAWRPGEPRGNRADRIMAIIASRQHYAAMTPEQRARVKVKDGGPPQFGGAHD